MTTPTGVTDPAKSTLSAPVGDPTSIDHLSYSQISTFLRCPRQWAEQKLAGKSGKPGTALVKGSVVDKIATANWRAAMAGEPGITPDEVSIVAEEVFVDHVKHAMGGRDNVDWETESYPRAMQSAADMAAVHLREHAPLVTPKAVQLKVNKPIPGTNRTLLGFVDAVGADDWLIDVKTGSRRMPQGDANTDLQATAYAWLVGEPIRFSFFRAIDTGRQVYGEVVDTTRSPAAIEQFEENARAVSNLIDSGNYPASPGWQCRWCPVKATCVDAWL